jgi:hypothetical protein
MPTGVERQPTVTGSQHERLADESIASEAALMSSEGLSGVALPDPISVVAADDCATLVVHGLLDERAGCRLLETATVATGWAARVEVDLLAVTGSTVEGEAALVACRNLPYDGVLVFRTDGGPGGDAILTAFTNEEHHVGESAADGDGVDLASE